MCKKTVILLLAAAIMTLPCYGGITATISTISNGWPAIPGANLFWYNYEDPNSPMGGPGTGDNEKVGENFNDRALMQTFRLPINSFNLLHPGEATYGFKLTNIVITGFGNGNPDLPPLTLHLFDLN